MKHDLAEIVVIPIQEFLKMAPAPGHRNSEGRAQKSTHLHILVPEHSAVEVAEYKDDLGMTHRCRMTGNTRAQVWKCGLSDHVPEVVQARVYKMKSEGEVRERMLRQDSPEAAWNSSDQMYRSMDMTFGDDWRPTSKVLKGGRFVMAIRAADSLVRNLRWSPLKSEKIEAIMPFWKGEIQNLDEMVSCPVEEVIRDRGPFTWGFLAACLVLLRFRPCDRVSQFVRAVLADNGKKDNEERDGVQALIDNLSGDGKNKKRTGSAPDQQQLLKTFIGSFDVWDQNSRVSNLKAVRKCDPLEWIRNEREAQRSAQKVQRIDAAE